MDSLERIQSFDFPIARISSPLNNDSTLEEVIKLPPKQQTFSIEFDLSYIRKF
jgi:hypothetical protein